MTPPTATAVDHGHVTVPAPAHAPKGGLGHFLSTYVFS